MEKKRCSWPGKKEKEPLMIKYHDEEWGVPVHDDKLHFEYLILDGFQAGLSWRTILNKRENFKKAFHGFNPEKIAKFTEKDVERLMEDEGIIRNRLKIKGAVKNAMAFLKLQKEFGSFDKYIWQFTKNKTIHSKFKELKELPARTEESDNMSKDLKKRGFTFVGPTICYAYMQAAGMVNDHVVDCFRYEELKGK
ncbi:MAG: DNA-3-methyladenine glycosylase I [Cytophagales bacterium]|nr:DNA-3-methyladenine glycosylase I [Cytophagales bacterium]